MWRWQMAVPGFCPATWPPGQGGLFVHRLAAKPFPLMPINVGFLSEMKATMMRNFTSGCLVFLFLSILLPALTGCGNTRGSVSGKVIYRDQPISSGTVLVHGPEGMVGASLVGSDESYFLSDLSTGLVRITVVTHAEIPEGLAKSPPPLVKANRSSPLSGGSPELNRPRKKPVQIPWKYSQPEHSNLVLTIRPGQQFHDILLTP